MRYPWSKTVVPIAAIFSFRMLGLFLLIPVFSIYAEHLQGATPALIGLALGVYGLAQGILQMPFGLFSDKIGRKPMISLGLLLFAAGSLLGAWTDSIYGMILARALQGTGAIGSVLIALLADLTADEQRTRAMAVIGMTIGSSFSLAMVISPALTHHFGLPGIFYLTAILALCGLFLVHFAIPQPEKERFHADSEANPVFFKQVIRNTHLQRLNVGIFCQHFILTATFFAIPFILNKQVEEGHLTQQWHFYLPLMLGSFLLMIPFVILAEKKKHIKIVFLLSVLVLSLTQWALAYNSQNWFALCVLMLAFFIAFNVLEAMLPSLISKQAPANCKGTAMGIYSTSQFLGLFLGGAIAGVLYEWHGSQAIFIINALLGLLWFLLSYSMKPNAYLTTLILPCSWDQTREEVVKKLLSIPGIVEIAFVKEEQVLYIRINKEQYREGSAQEVLT